MRLVEDLHEALDKGQIIGALLMDLSKIFDPMPHDLLMAKLKAHGWSEKAVLLIGAYLSNRKEQVKVTDTLSSWMEILMGLPQGSLLGPIIFNIFINYIITLMKNLYVITTGCCQIGSEERIKYCDWVIQAKLYSSQTYLVPVICHWPRQYHKFFHFICRLHTPRIEWQKSVKLLG